MNDESLHTCDPLVTVTILNLKQQSSNYPQIFQNDSWHLPLLPDLHHDFHADFEPVLFSPTDKIWLQQITSEQTISVS